VQISIGANGTTGRVSAGTKDWTIHKTTQNKPTSIQHTAGRKTRQARKRKKRKRIANSSLPLCMAAMTFAICLAIAKPILASAFVVMVIVRIMVMVLAARTL
jgi:hypothetical protein